MTTTVPTLQAATTLARIDKLIANEIVADALEQAAIYVDAGWCQGHMVEPRTGNVCAAGAINRACPHNVAIRDAATSALAKVFRDQFPAINDRCCGSDCDFGTVIRGNDQHATSADQVSTCMRKAAVDLRGAL